MADTSVSMSKAEWAEAYYAMESKIRGIQAGTYGKEDYPGQNKEWIAMMRSAMRKIAKKVRV